jgi:hypothetical protein
MTSDTQKLRIGQPDGSYTRVDRRGKEPVNSQEVFQSEAVEAFRRVGFAAPEEYFRPNLPPEKDGEDA